MLGRTSFCAYASHRYLILGSGIGLESSILFAQEGATVLLVDVNLEGAQKAVDLIKKRLPNARVFAHKTDVSKEEEVKAVIDRVVKEFGRLDIMVSLR